MKYNWLEKHLPEMDCQRCGECCGVIICTKKENAAIKVFVEDYGIEIVIKTKHDCPYFRESIGCLIYPVRPYICRLMGHTGQLLCKQGHNTNIKLRKTRKLFELYVRKLGDPCIAIHGSPYEGEINSKEILARITKAKQAYGKAQQPSTAQMLDPLIIAAQARKIADDIANMKRNMEEE